MNEYVFKCEDCNIKDVRTFSIKQYDELKNKQFCPTCGKKMKRVFTPISGVLYHARGFYCTGD